MKKTIAILSCCAVMVACNNATENTAENETAQENTYTDATSDAEVNAASRQSEVDTSVNNIGTDRSNVAEQTTDDYEKGKKLIAQSDCLSCHQVDKKLVGPAYADVAKKYEMNEKNIDYLSNKIIQGGAGVWGQIPMTPHPDLSKEDAAEMAKYVLSLNK
ncbi:c-type cytochrome [Pontibacter chitinilyticus]|uniref:c-type cytochrome n=1 Tax=Pontibacter chitinilyticus TaxID=2674989 RepID=UPI00321B9DC6